MTRQPDLRPRETERVSIITQPHLPTARQVRLMGGNRGFAITQLNVERRIGANANTFDGEIIDTGGGFHSAIQWGDRLRCILGGDIVFGGFITDLERDIVGPTGVSLRLRCTGLEHLLYHKQIHGNPDYSGLDTREVARRLIDEMALEWLSHDITGDSGVDTPAGFAFEDGDTVGEGFERLTQLDGHTFWVLDVEDDFPEVHYDVPTDHDPQDIIREEDLREGAPMQEGSTPPRTVARMVAPDGTHTHLANAASRLFQPFGAFETGTMRIYNADGFSADGGECRVGYEDMTYSGKGTDATSDFLTITERGINDTREAFHQEDAMVMGEAAYQYGFWIHEENLKENVDGTQAAQTMLAQHSKPGNRFTLPLRDFRKELTPFAPVRVLRPRLGINDDYAISSVRHELLQDGNLGTTVTVGTLEYDVARSLEHLRKET